MGVSRAIPTSSSGGSNELLIVIRAIDQATNTLKIVGKGTKVLGTDIKDLAATWYLASQAVKVFSAGVKAAYDFGKEGAQIERLRETGTALARGFGVDMAEAVRKIKAASLDTISANQAIAATNRLILLGITTDTTTMAKLMEIAALRGRAFGIDTEAAFDRITLGIGRLSTRILDDIGIVIDGEAAYARYASAIGKTGDQLTENQKRLALTAAIIEEGNQLLEISGGLVLDNATAFTRLETHVTDAMNAIKVGTADAIAPLVTGLDALLFSTMMLDGLMVTHQQTVKDAAQSYQDYKDQVISANDKLLEQYRDNPWLVFLAIGQRGMGIGTIIDAFGVLSKVNRQFAAGGRGPSQDETWAIIRDFLLKQFGGVTERDLLGGWMGAQLKKKRIVGGGGKVTGDEIAGVRTAMDRATEARKFREELDRMLKDLDERAFDASKEAAARRLDLDIDYGRKKEDIAIDLARDLEDINIKLQDDIEDTTRKHKERLVNVEKTYYRDINRIMRRFEMAKLRALIDLDGKALFEAEASRDADLADAQATRKEHRDEESDSFAQKLRDQEDQAERERRQAMLDNERKRGDAARDYQRQLDDQRRAWGQRLYELYALGAQEFQIVRSQQRAITQIMLDEWNIRADAYAAYLRTIGPTGTTATGAIAPTASTGGAATGMNVYVNLNVTGDGVLAQAMRQSTINTVYDMIYSTRQANYR